MATEEGRPPVTLLRREFTVDLPLSRAWEHLAQIEQWPSWAPHIKRIELQPPGELRQQSTGILHLKNGMRPTFRVTEFNLPHNWIWVGNFLWATVIYDHQFEPLDAGHTKLTWIVAAKGFGASILGRLFARIYRVSLDRAIPLLIAEMNASALSA